MGCSHNLICGLRLHHFAISLLFLLISSSSHSYPSAKGRISVQQAANRQTVNEDGKSIFRAKIGSKQPRCKRTCSSCAHCEAIQVPINSQIKNSSPTSGIAYNRGNDNSNYKPMSWKCKCGNLIFNP